MDGKPASLLIPALEVPALNIGIWGYDKLTNRPYANINLFTMGRNISGAWVWDSDTFSANAFGHPYHGSLFFTAARSSGLSFWKSAPYVLFGSLMWEVLMETLPPSRNDLILTTIGGIFLGEILHRTSLLVLDEGHPTILRSVLSGVIEPVGFVNRFFFGRRANDFFPHTPHNIFFSAGVNANVRNTTDVGGVRTFGSLLPQAHLELEIQSGLPGDPRWRPRQPFDQFSLLARVEAGRETYFGFFVDGLLVGTSFNHVKLPGFWGLFGGYDYSSPTKMRAASTFLGPGVSVRWQLSPTLFFVPKVIIAGVPFGAAGSLVPPVNKRDYHYGPGGQVIIDLELLSPGLGRFGVRARGYFITGAFLGEGWDRIGYFTTFAEVAITNRYGIGFDAFFADRKSVSPGVVGDTVQRILQFRIYLTVVAGDGFDGLVHLAK